MSRETTEAALRPSKLRLKHRQVRLGDITELHPAVAEATAAAPGGYLARDLSGIMPAHAEMLTLTAPIIVVGRETSLRRVAGHRTYQVARLLLGDSVTIPVWHLLGSLGTESVRAIGEFCAIAHPLLVSLDQAGLHQIDAALAELAPGYRRAAPGRPRRDADESSRMLLALSGEPMSTVRLARICAVSPSTLRRGRVGNGGGG